MSKPIVFSLSERRMVREYLDATAPGIVPSLQEQIEMAKSQVVLVQSRLEIARAAYAAVTKRKAEADAEYTIALAEEKGKFEAERRRLSGVYNEGFNADERKYGVCLFGKRHPRGMAPHGGDDVESAASWAQVQEARAALDSYEKQGHKIPAYNGPSSEASRQAASGVSTADAELREAEGKLREAEGKLREAEAKLRRAQDRIEATSQAMGTRRDLDRDLLHRVADFAVPAAIEGHDEDGLWNPSVSYSVGAGMLRRELSVNCPGCNEGYMWVSVVEDGSIKMYLDDKVRHPFCRDLADFSVAPLQGAVPEAFVRHRLHSLTPWAASPVPQEEQARLIAQVPSESSDYRGWVMLGPPGTSKSTYAAAAVCDMLTWRLWESKDRHYSYDSPAPRSPRDLNFWRIKVPKWLRDMEAWDHRDFGDENAVRPDIEPDHIEKMTAKSGFPPLLWLEEIDKFKSTETRRQLLFSLIDAVYEEAGCIITTSNETVAVLRKLVGEPIWRRLTGENDAPGEFLLWTLWPPETRKKGKA